jgi:hypothetical protein
VNIRTTVNESSAHLVEEVVEKLDVDKHGRGVRKFLCDNIQEHFGTEYIVV